MSFSLGKRHYRVVSFRVMFQHGAELFMEASVNTARRDKASAEKAKRYLRKWEVATRYGVTGRTVERMSADGRLPPPIRRGREFSCGTRRCSTSVTRRARRFGKRSHEP